MITKRRKFALAKQRKVLAAARQHILDNGAVADEGGRYILETNVGKLMVSFDEGHECATVFARFDEPGRAVAAMKYDGINPHSGKWNHHWSRDNADAGLMYFRYIINILTA